MSIIAIRTLNTILPIVLQRYGVNEFADNCRTIDSMEQAVQVTRQASGSTSYAGGAHLYSLMPLHARNATRYTPKGAASKQLISRPTSGIRPDYGAGSWVKEGG